MKSFHRSLRPILVSTLILVCGTFLSAQEAAPADQPATQPTDQSAEAQKEPAELIQFNHDILAYKEKLIALRTLKAEYQIATPQRRDAIATEYKPLAAETETLQKNLVPSGIAAFKATEGKEPTTVNFLIGMLEWMVIKKENYETAFEIADTLVPADVLKDNFAYLNAYAAYAAFNVMELEKAEAWYKIAQEKNGLADLRKYDPKDDMKISYVIEQILPEYKDLWAKEKAIREKEAADDNLPRVLLKTTKGDIVLELFANEAPEAVGNFLSLVNDKFYTDVPFHRVLPFFMAQGGDPTGTGSGGPGYCIKCECGRPDARMHFRGSLSMAHAGRNTGGSQFFLTFVPTGFLNGRHTVFGRIIEGMDVLSELQRIDPEGQNLPAPDKIIEAQIVRGEPTEFTKLPAR